MAKKTTKRPDRYRNLYLRGKVIYFEKLSEGRRIKMSMRTDDWDVALERRDEAERLAKSGAPAPSNEIPTLFDWGQDYLSKGMGSLARKTQDDRRAILRRDGPLMRSLGDERIDRLAADTLFDWFERSDLALSSQRNVLIVLGELTYRARRKRLLRVDPVIELREDLKRRGWSKSEPNPIERPEDVRAFVRALDEEKPEVRFACLLMLFLGLRIGEATALAWEDLMWQERLIHVRRNFASGRYLRDSTKGRQGEQKSRHVGASRFLLGALRAEWLRQGRPESGAIAKVGHSNFGQNTLPRILRRAGVEQTRRLTPHSLRSTFATHTIAMGAPVEAVRKELGHRYTSTTEASYRAELLRHPWYRHAPRLGAEDCPGDLLGWLVTEAGESKAAVG